MLPLERWLDDATLRAIAAEANLSETAFTVPAPAGSGADYALRWFTPTTEVEMCGHGTLAAGHVLLGARACVRFATRHAGLLTVARAGEGYALSLPALPPAPRPLPEIARAIGGSPRETLWHDRSYAVLVYADEAAVRALAPDFAGLRAFGDTAFVATAPGAASDVVSRVFVPGAGVDEDPVTGSAHAVIAPYWAARLGRDRFSAYQASARGGRLDCRLDGDRVVLVGACVTVIEGVLTL